MENIIERRANNPFEVDDIQAKAHAILEEYAEAARDGLLNTKAYEMEQYLRFIELQKNRLNISNDDNAARIFYSGQIAGIMQFCKFLNESRKNESEYIHISQHNKLLTKCILFIGEKNTVSSSDIIKNLNLKHRSSLTNMIERQKPLSLISTYKIHNRNIYMLTEKGRQMYYHHVLIQPTYGSKEQTVGDMIDILIQAFDQENVNQFSIVADWCEIDNSLERYLTSISFSKKLASYIEALSCYVQKEMRRTIVGKMRYAKVDTKENSKWSIQENNSIDPMELYPSDNLG